LTLTNVAEAAGIARAAQAVGVPVAISFTVETDGALPTGMALADAIAEVDAATDGAPAYYMLNCAHPDHFGDAIATNDPNLERLRGVRANASRLSHAELDASGELDAGDPAELAAGYVALRGRLPALSILGGCCGTDARHVAAIASAVLGEP
jgi:S-methylmethionine-dependent homocysteine/selenocysteine methylase